MTTLILGDCLEKMKEIETGSVDAIVTDPPYGLSFMGKDWDKGVPGVHFWEEMLRVLKPGGHLLSFAGTRTQHRMAVNIEDAGFEIRDMIAWVYGSGFPKSLNVSKAIDKAAGAEREVVGPNPNSRPNMVRVDAAVLSPRVDAPITAPATESAKKWQGFGTALKPALEPITLARKPFKGTVAANVLEHGTGSINVDGCRVGVDPAVDDMLRTVDRGKRESETWENGSGFKNEKNHLTGVPANGRWPANLILTYSEDVVGLFPVTGGGGKPQQRDRAASAVPYTGSHRPEYTPYKDTATGGGSAARFFYCAKASKKDRGEDNKHPTVKPNDLMRYLVRLITPPGGTVLDPFMGSGSTGKAAVMEGFEFIGIEMDEDYFEIAKARIESATQEK